jgi:hypothetical protein
MGKYYIQPRRKETTYAQLSEERLTGVVTSCVGTAFYKTLVKERKSDE